MLVALTVEFPCPHGQQMFYLERCVCALRSPTEMCTGETIKQDFGNGHKFKKQNKQKTADTFIIKTKHNIAT